MKKLTPVLFVERIEPCLPFWVDRLGFEKTVEVPAGDGIGFCILVHGEVELMLQSRASVADDVPALSKGPFANDGLGLYLEVEDIAKVRDAVNGCEIVVPERTTFYGAREIGVRAPGGFTVLFSAKA
jgi:uncharacterized glyoxalase superfamily protein PhnB